jgi:type I restriction enzyme, S subunit
MVDEVYNLNVNLNYETSARCGADGMFQVNSITDDENNKDYTNLVDQGTHYYNLNELAKDIAAALKVSVSQIDLTEEIHSN